MDAHLEIDDGVSLSVKPLADDRTTIGRDPASDVVLDDRAVSRLHAAVERVGGSFIIRDFGSSNGTLLNGAPVAGEAALHDGDEVDIGKRRLLFRSDVDELGQTSRIGGEDPRLTRRERELLVTVCRLLAHGVDSDEPLTARRLAEMLPKNEQEINRQLIELYPKFEVTDMGRGSIERLAAEAVRRRAVRLTEIAPEPGSGAMAYVSDERGVYRWISTPAE